MLLAALAERGLAIQPFKVGPDFIDPGYHRRFAGVPSRNLDFWLMNEAGIIRETATHGAGKISIVEGVMGLFDGSDVKSDEGSTMAVARLLDWPLLLVISSAGAGRSLAAALRGFLAETDLIAGVILNGVSGGGHADYLREAIAPLKLPVLGAIPVCSELSWPERHLGLQANQERGFPARKEFAQLAESYLDLAAILALLEGAAPSAPPGGLRNQVMEGAALSAPKDGLPDPVEKQIRIALARDKAFHFYYEANLDYLAHHGVEVVEFSPLNDSKLPPDLDGIIIGGGFPEIFAEELSQNQAILTEIRSAIADGLNCYAECGGLILLAEELVAQSGRRFPMAGVIPGSVEMTPALQHFGYCECFNLARAQSETFHGHEFHHSRWTAEPWLANLWTVRRKRLGSTRPEGFQKDNLHASYVHLYFSGSQAVLRPFVNQTRIATL
jgi:cobyrinic acid a,c-diamide synthase